MKKRNANKLVLALAIMLLLGASTLVFSANESSPWGSKKRIMLYEEVPRPDMTRRDEPVEMEEDEEAFISIVPEFDETIVLAFGSQDTQQLEFEMEEEKYNIKLSEEDIKRIEKIDKKNSKINISNYKKLLGDFDVSANQQKELRKYFDKDRDPADIYFAYEYIYYHDGTFEELEAVLEARENGKDWLRIFED